MPAQLLLTKDEQKLVNAINELTDIFFGDILDGDAEDHLTWQRNKPSERSIVGRYKLTEGQLTVNVEDTPWLDHGAWGSREWAVFELVALLCDYYAEAETYDLITFTKVKPGRRTRLTK